jgi:hypothetical protein
MHVPSGFRQRTLTNASWQKYMLTDFGMHADGHPRHIHGYADGYAHCHDKWTSAYNLPSSTCRFRVLCSVGRQSIGQLASSCRVVRAPSYGSRRTCRRLRLQSGKLNVKARVAGLQRRDIGVNGSPRAS